MKRKPFFHRLLPLGAFLLISLLFGNALPAAEQTPCTEDIAKFCGDVGRSRGALLRCLEEHEAQLSSACRAYETGLEQARTESREAGRRQMRIRAACRDDTLRFCADVAPGGGSVLTCLKGHVEELSRPCGDAVKAAQTAEEASKK